MPRQGSGIRKKRKRRKYTPTGSTQGLGASGRASINRNRINQMRHRSAGGGTRKNVYTPYAPGYSPGKNNTGTRGTGWRGFQNRADFAKAVSQGKAGRKAGFTSTSFTSVSRKRTSRSSIYNKRNSTLRINPELKVSMRFKPVHKGPRYRD